MSARAQRYAHYKNPYQAKKRDRANVVQELVKLSVPQILQLEQAAMSPDHKGNCLKGSFVKLAHELGFAFSTGYLRQVTLDYFRSKP